MVSNYCEVSNYIDNVMLIIVQKYVYWNVMSMHICVLKSVICIDDIILRAIESTLFSIRVVDLTHTL